MKKQNETDLHIQFKLDTGKDHAYDMHFIEKDVHYKREYQCWLESLTCNLLNEKIVQDELLIKIDRLERENSSLGEDIYDLEAEISMMNDERYNK